MNSHFDEYVSLRGKSRHQFWHTVFNGWWDRYPWRLPDDKEPPADDPEKMKELAYVGGEKDKQAKMMVEKATREVGLSAEIFTTGMIDTIVAEDHHLVQLSSDHSQL